MVASDVHRDPQALVLAPESAIAIAQAIVAAPTDYAAGKAAALTALGLIRNAHNGGSLKLPPRELPWLERLQTSLDTLPDDESQFIDLMMAHVHTTRFRAADYDLG